MWPQLVKCLRQVLVLETEHEDPTEKEQLLGHIHVLVLVFETFYHLEE